MISTVEASIVDLPKSGLSPDYVFRETRRALEGVRGQCDILPGIDVNIPTGRNSRTASPDDTYSATIERNLGVILAWHNGKRRDKDFLILWCLLANFSIARYYTDNWGAYSKYIPASRHRTGKDNTWKIERKNLNFRTHLKRLTRKTICFSKNEQIHDNMIGMYLVLRTKYKYIERFYYKTGTYGNN